MPLASFFFAYPTLFAVSLKDSFCSREVHAKLLSCFFYGRLFGQDLAKQLDSDCVVNNRIFLLLAVLRVLLRGIVNRPELPRKNTGNWNYIPPAHFDDFDFVTPTVSLCFRL